VRRILDRLRPVTDDRDVILIGGQAVAVWTEFFKGAGAPPVTSWDIDFEGSATAAKKAAALLDAKTIITPRPTEATPIIGEVHFVDSDGIERELDFVRAPRGLDPDDVRDSAVRWLIPDPANDREIPVWVMHPERCMESKIYNTVELEDRTGPLAMNQLRASVICARAWSMFLLDSAVDEKELEGRVKAVRALNERIAERCVKDQAFRKVYVDHEVDPFEAVVADDRLGKMFVRRRYPQLSKVVAKQRALDQQRWRRT
jgi:hypothetical protein